MTASKSIGSAGVKALAQGCEFLRTLVLEPCRDISGPALRALAARRATLTQLRLAGVR
jgi:hypothetical protein